MSVVWNEKQNQRSEIQNIKVNQGDIASIDFNTKLIPNSLLEQFKKMEGNTYSVPGYHDFKVISITLYDNGNKTTMILEVI